MKSRSDWTRLQPRPKNWPDTVENRQARFSYLFEFMKHNRGSQAARDKAYEEMKTLSASHHNGPHK